MPMFSVLHEVYLLYLLRLLIFADLQILNNSVFFMRSVSSRILYGVIRWFEGRFVLGSFVVEQLKSFYELLRC